MKMKFLIALVCFTLITLICNVKAASVQLAFEDDYSDENYDYGDRDGRDGVDETLDDEEDAGSDGDDAAPSLPAGIPQVQGEPITKAELKQIVDSFRGAFKSINLTPGELFCKAKARLIGSGSKFFNYLGDENGFQYYSPTKGVMFSINDENFCNIIDAVFGYNTDVKFALNNLDATVKASEIRKTLPAVFGFHARKKLTMKLTVGGRKMTFMVDPKFRSVIRWILLSNRYVRLDLNTEVFGKAARALTGRIGWEEVLYSFLTAQNALFGTPVIFNDNLIVAPLKPGLMALTDKTLAEILKSFMSDEPLSNTGGVVLRTVGLQNLMQGYQGVNQITALLIALRNIEAKKLSNVYVDSKATGKSN